MDSPYKYELHGYGYTPGGNIYPTSEPLSPLFKGLMQTSLEQAEIALSAGGTPVGAALVNLETGQQWSHYSNDVVSGELEGHAELKCYRAAQLMTTRRIGQFALVSTTELCPPCVSAYAQDNIETIIIAAPWSTLTREDGTSIVPRRGINMGHVLQVSGTRMRVYSGYRSDEAVELWRRWDKRRSS